MDAMDMELDCDCWAGARSGPVLDSTDTQRGIEADESVTGAEVGATHSVDCMGWGSSSLGPCQYRVDY